MYALLLSRLKKEREKKYKSLRAAADDAKFETEQVASRVQFHVVLCSYVEVLQTCASYFQASHLFQNSWLGNRYPMIQKTNLLNAHRE